MDLLKTLRIQLLPEKRRAIYFDLLALFKYCSIAIDIEGALGKGALTSSVNPASSTALAVVGPKAAIRVFHCLNF